MAAKKKRTAAPPPPPVRTKPPRASAPAGPTRRETEREAAASRANLQRRLVAGALVMAALAAGVGYVVVDRRNSAELTDALTSGTCTVDQRTDRTGAPGKNHVTAPTFSVDPPAGGDHLAGAARAGVFSGTSVPSDGLLVHSLEHGYVVLWHRPDLPAAQLRELADVQAAHDGDVIVAERPTLEVPVAATAWGRRLLCQETEVGVLERFVEQYVGDGPEDVPRG